MNVGIQNAKEIFDTPEIPYEEDGGLVIIIGQGAEGEYNSGSKLKFIFHTLGAEWKFVDEIKEPVK
ncbi:MAG: hypothetical protein ACRCYE_05490 [Sarcina sp.]